MRRLIFLFLILLIPHKHLTSQEINGSPLRYIEVTGSSEMEVAPDEIIVSIGIQEYWMEEFSSNAKFKDYKTKVPIWVIENNLIADLNKIGILKEDIDVEDISSYGRYWGKEFLFAKEFTISLNTMEKVNLLFQTIDTKGIESIFIAELKNKQITEYRRQVKIEAFEAAKVKASYLVGCMDKQLGEIISIVELDPERNSFRNMQDPFSNTVLNTPESDNDNVRAIKLRYEVKAKFEIGK